MLDSYTMEKNLNEFFDDTDIFNNDEKYLDEQWIFIYGDGSEKRLDIEEFNNWISSGRGRGLLTLPDKDLIVKVIVPKIVKEIAFGSFQHFCSLKEVVLHDEIKRINNFAFKECISLEKINFPNNLEYIGRRAFQQCKSLKEINLLNIREIGDFAFIFSRLQEFMIWGDIETIPPSCFEGCNNLRHIIAPSRLMNNLWNQFLFYDYTHLFFYDYGHIKDVLSNNDCSITLLGENFSEIYECLKNFLSQFKDNKYRGNFESFNNHFTLKIESDYLSWKEKQRIKYLLSKIKLKNIVFVSTEELRLSAKKEIILDKKENVNMENMNIGLGEDNQKLLDDINKLVKDLSLDSKKVILEKVKTAIDIYEKSVKEEKPILNLEDESVFSFNDKMIGDADFSLKVELSNIKMFLEKHFKTLKLLSDLEEYKKILGSKVEKSTDKNDTIENIITNIVYLASQLDENNKEDIMKRIHYYLDEAYNNYQNELDKEFDGYVKLQFKEELEPKTQLHLNLSHYLDEVKLNYEYIIPYITLMNCLKSKSGGLEYVEADTIEDFINDIRYILLQFSNSAMQERLIRLFDKIITEYIEKIESIILDNEERINYQEFEILFRKDLQFFLEKLNNYISLNDLSFSLEKCLNLLEEKKLTEDKETIEILFIKDILESIEKASLNNQEKSQAISKVLTIIDRCLFKINGSLGRDADERKNLQQELHKELFLIKLKLDIYGLRKERYSKFYLNNNENYEIKKLIKNKDTSTF